MVGCGGSHPAAPPSGGTGASASVAAGMPAGRAVIEGRVTLDGPAPTMAMINMNSDNYCQTHHPAGVPSQEIVDTQGALQWVLVYVKSGLPAGGKYPVPTVPAVIDQVDCMYVPHVLGVRAGQPVKFVNSDATLHNVHPLCKVNTPFNLGQPLQGMTQERTFTKPEFPPFHIRCDVHRWMSAWCGVFDNPYFTVTDKDGGFRLTGLPAGTYVVETWQEKLGVRDQTVTVADRQPQTANFVYKAS